MSQAGAPLAVNMYGSVVFGETSKSAALVAVEILSKRLNAFLPSDCVMGLFTGLYSLLIFQNELITQHSVNLANQMKR